MINHSYKPCLVLNVVFHLSSSFILIWWYPRFKSILEKIHAPYNSSNMSSSLRIGCRYFTVMLLTMDSQHTSSKFHLFLARVTLVQHKGSYSHECIPASSNHLLAFKAPSSPGIAFIGWKIRNRSSKYKVDLMFNSP
jgi:hypothetical protein